MNEHPRLYSPAGSYFEAGGQFIRDYYQVPAHIGRKITFQGLSGSIVGFAGTYLMADVEGYVSPIPLHPTWQVEYLGVSL